jgi:predicted ATPase/DNA-binding CsgD family transcriptional regulator
MTITTNHASARWRVYGLPAEVTSFVGRRREVADVRRMLSRSRLVTLTGPGGVGKTRLAYRVAAQTRRDFPDGVWLVELAELDNPALLVNTVAQALSLHDQTRRPVLDALLDQLRERTALLVLDNCEHVLHECALFADALLRAAPEVRILATSRQVLGIAGEQALAVPVLSLPATGPSSCPARLSTECFARYDAVRLFAERARAVLPDFAITAANRDAIERICRRLDGIPLAIELAAVRLRVLSLQQLLDGIDDRFRLLDSGSRAVLPRHRTLRALIDWSYSLCTRQERLLWARASVFSGGMDLEAAQAVCSGDGIAPEEVFDVVASMVDKSILMREEHPLGTRYRLLETMREYGRDRLAESGEEAEIHRRHRDFYRRLCAVSREHLFGPGQIALLTRLRAENANLRSALDSLFNTPEEAAAGLSMATGLLHHWITGHLREGRRRLDEGLTAVAEPGLVRGRALVVDSWLAVIQGESDHAARMLEEAHEIGERLGDVRLLADVALHNGLIALDREDTERAIERCEAAVSGQRRTEDLTNLARAYLWLIAARTQHGELREAVRLGEKAVALCDAHGERLYRGYIATMLGTALWRQGDTRPASALARESLEFHRALGNPRGIAISLSLLAWVSASEGRYEKAARLLGTLRSFSLDPSSRRALGVPVSGYRHLAHYQDECRAEIKRAIGEADLDAAINLGAGLAIDEALAYALRDEPDEEAAPAGRARLTRRETEVAGLIADGLSNKRISAELRISQRTVEGHVKHILAKLGFGSRIQIAAWIEEHDGAGAPPRMPPS